MSKKNNWRKVLSWQVQREQKDTRRLFDAVTSRKPSIWDEVKKYLWGGLTDAMEEALLSKQVVDMDLEYPLDIFPVNVPETMEFIMHELSSDKYYYVNAEGYNYAKYIFEIVNFPNN